MGTSLGDNPVVEAGLTAHREDVTLRALQQRIRQQEILSELGVMALQGATFDHLLDETARLTAEGLRSGVLQNPGISSSENRLLVRAGVGWGPDIVGIATVAQTLNRRRVLPCEPASRSFPTILRMTAFPNA